MVSSSINYNTSFGMNVQNSNYVKASDANSDLVDGSKFIAQVQQEPPHIGLLKSVVSALAERINRRLDVDYDQTARFLRSEDVTYSDLYTLKFKSEGLEKKVYEGLVSSWRKLFLLRDPSLPVV